MLAKVFTGVVVGMDGALVDFEVDIAQNELPNFLIVGLPDTAVQEARERVRAAIRISGLSFPKRRITMNLAPADLKQEWAQLEPADCGGYPPGLGAARDRCPGRAVPRGADPRGRAAAYGGDHRAGIASARAGAPYGLRAVDSTRARLHCSAACG
jgi:hypothetical protein